MQDQKVKNPCKYQADVGLHNVLDDVDKNAIASSTSPIWENIYEYVELRIKLLLHFIKLTEDDLKC